MSAFDDNEPRVVELPDDEEEEFQDCAEGPQGSKPNHEASLNSDQLENNDVVQNVENEDVTAKEGTEEEGEESVVPPSPVFTHPKDIEKALAAKEAGNEYFRQKDYDNAIQCYSNAIAYCPNDPESKEHVEQLATFYGNRAAAYFAEEEWELVIDDCSYALDHKPDYVKVLLRRMQAYEKMDKLEEALADAKKIQELDPSTPKIASTVARLQKQYDEKMNKLKDEALGKLKELGNSLLGNFGLSLDNFKMQQDPSTGSWSISMNNK